MDADTFLACWEKGEGLPPDPGRRPRELLDAELARLAMLRGRLVAHEAETGGAARES